MLEKELNKLTKYYICSEHFEDDCFLDPETKTRLKKNLRPIKVPIPTIFKCNFDKVIPKDISLIRPVTTSIKIKCSPTKSTKSPATKQHSPVKLRQSGGESQKKESEEVSQFIENIELKDDEHLVEICEIETEEETEILIEQNVCRLCFGTFDELIDIFSEVTILEQLNIVLPGEIHSEDSLPHGICSKCIEELDTASRILTKFNNTQQMLRNSQ